MKYYDDLKVGLNAPYSTGCKAILVGVREITTVPISTLKWNSPEDEQIAEVYDGWLTLKEIANQLQALGYGHVFYVWTEQPLFGAIYEYGNQPNLPHWIEHGKTNGYC